ncbi:hypothetical protein Neosp_004171 [[Neocosmospora] mangrovei]
MKLLAGLALASMAVAAPLVEKRAPTPLNVSLEMQGNSKIKAVITNNGKSNLKAVEVGCIQEPTEKNIPFDGVRVALDTSRLEETAFQRIPSGESIEVDFDIAEFHDLSAGGKFNILAEGALSFAQDDSTELIGSVPFYSNRIEAEVDGPQAFSVRTAFHHKRTQVQSDCSGDKLAITQNALNRCANMASKAQQAAANGPGDKMKEYFKSDSSETRQTVSDVFGRIASECGSTTAGDSRYYCSDVYGACQSGVLAYTVPGASYMAYCDLYFQALPATTTSCHGQDQAQTNVHEMTHLNQIKGTSDYGGYGYNFLQSLSADQNINHADTYALFANAIELGC